MWKNSLALMALTAVILVGCNNANDNAMNDVERGVNDATNDVERGVNDVIDDVTPEVNNNGVNNNGVNNNTVDGVDRNNGAATPGGTPNDTQINEGVSPNGVPATENREGLIEDEADLKDRDHVDNH